MCFPLEVVDAVRAAIAESTPLFVRVSAVDGTAQGRNMDDTILFATPTGQIIER